MRTLVMSFRRYIVRFAQLLSRLKEEKTNQVRILDNPFDFHQTLIRHRTDSTTRHEPRELIFEMTFERLKQTNEGNANVVHMSLGP